MTGLTILHLLPALEYGGVERYVIGLSGALTRRGHRCIIVSAGGRLLPEAEATGVEHINLAIRNQRGPAATARLARIINREHVDLLNAHNWTAGAVGFLAARLAQIPYIFTVHGLRDPLQRFFVYYWGPRVVTVSAASRDHLTQAFGLPDARVVTSAIGVDTDRFRPRPAAPSLLHEFALPANAPRIVHVSRFSRGKAEIALRLIEAGGELERQAPGFQAIIVGEGPLARQVAAAVENADRRLGRRAFIFAGARGDVADLMSLADVVVGTGMVALEAMACGKPLVAAGKAGFVGLVTPERFSAARTAHFGDHAAVEPITPANLANAIGAALEGVARPSAATSLWDGVAHPNGMAEPAAGKACLAGERAAQLGEFGRRAIMRYFGWPRIAAQVEDIYRDALVGARPTRRRLGGVRRIAVFHLNQIGDLIFSLPALSALRERFPDAEIASILRPYLAELMQDCPFVDRLISRAGGLGAEMRLARELRGCRFDLVVAFSQSASTVLQALACAARTRIGFVDADLSFLLTRKVHVRGVPWPGKLARLAVCLGAQPPRASYVGMLRISDAVRARARALLRHHGVDDAQRIAIIAPGASGRRRYKAWEAHKFAQVADHLQERFAARVVIVGGTADALEAGRIASSMAMPAVQLAGKTTTGELAAIAERAELLVGIDSGPMHVAAAMGTPTVALFGPTDHTRTGPHGEGHQIITAAGGQKAAGLPCSPCVRGRSGRPESCEARACMRGITVQQVVEAADRVMGARARRASVSRV